MANVVLIDGEAALDPPISFVKFRVNVNRPEMASLFVTW
jgi:hypothetical protein